MVQVGGGVGAGPLGIRPGQDRDAPRRLLLQHRPAMTLQPVVEADTGRWSLETTLQEMRPYLGPETARGRREATVLRMAPCLFGLSSVVALLDERLPAPWARLAGVDWA